MVGLKGKANGYAGGLSGGMRGRCVLGRALVHSEGILVLGEATAGVDIGQRVMLCDSVRQLNADGMTVILTTHYLEEAQEMCDQIAIIHEGALRALDTTVNLLSKLDTKTLVVETEATTTCFVGVDCFYEAAIGNGPVNAVDTAMLKALVAAYPSLADVELVDYKVRILDAAEGSGTGAVTRVMIEFCVPGGPVWRTVGLSTNIIDASVAALVDGMIWNLQHATIAGPKSISK